MTYPITYRLEPELSADEYIDVLIRSTLSERRPINDRPTIEKMLAQADIIMTARSGGTLVGISPHSPTSATARTFRIWP